jgi:hypothetical protein
MHSPERERPQSKLRIIELESWLYGDPEALVAALNPLIDQELAPAELSRAGIRLRGMDAARINPETGNPPIERFIWASPFAELGSGSRVDPITYLREADAPALIIYDRSLLTPVHNPDDYEFHGSHEAVVASFVLRFE